MSCSYKDGDYCTYCCSFLNGNIRDMERVTGCCCTDDYNCCMLAAYIEEQYEEYEQWHEAWKAGEVDKNGNKIVKEEKKTNKVKASSIGGESTFRKLLSKVGKILLFSVAIIFASVSSSWCVDPLFTNNSRLTCFLRFVSITGVPTLFVVCFKRFRWKAVLILVGYICIGFLNYLARSYNIGWMTVFGYVLGIIGFVISIIAGAVPGLIAYVITLFLPGMIRISNSYEIVLVCSIMLTSGVFGLLFAGFLEKYLKSRKNT